MKKYITTIVKYAFAVLLSFVTLKTTKNFAYVALSILELAAIFAVSDVLIRKSKWFNILNSVLMLLFNSELIVLLFGNSYISFVMLQSLTSVEDLQGKAFLYTLGVILVVAFSVLPIKPIEKLGKKTLIALPVLVIADILFVALSSTAMSPYAGVKDLYTQYADYNNMKKMVEEYKAQAGIVTTDENGEASSSGYTSVIGGTSEYSSSLGTPEDNASVVTENGTVADSQTETSSVNSGENNDVVVPDDGTNVSSSENAAVESVSGEGDTTVAVTTQPTSKLDSKLAKQFPMGSAIPHNTLPANTNVIVIFVEGLSENVISDPRDIMPNLKAFKNESITFTNYYNHTFATYRGIQGQLYSGYSLDDYETNHLPSLMDVLKAHGYNTVCINVEPSNREFTNYLNNMAFDKVVTGSGGEEGAVKSLSDRQAYSVLYDTAKEYNGKGKPFFICLYSFGTHVSFDTDENIYGDGSNNFMNRYHNCDFQIGAFIDDFKKSSFGKNTLLIITADHSAYSDEDFVKTFPEYYRGNPACDKIPLYVYYNGITTSINAQGRNSLDMAPTVLDLLGYERPATFVGYSLYSAKNENTILDSFYWNPDSCVYTGDGSIQSVKKDIKDYVQSEVIRYISMK